MKKLTLFNGVLVGWIISFTLLSISLYKIYLSVGSDGGVITQYIILSAIILMVALAVIFDLIKPISDKCVNRKMSRKSVIALVSCIMCDLLLGAFLFVIGFSTATNVFALVGFVCLIFGRLRAKMNFKENIAYMNN